MTTVAWTAEMTDRLHDLRNAGLEPREIAERMCLSRASVMAKLRCPPSELSVRRLVAIEPLLDDGLSISAIARRLGLTKNTVIGLLHRHRRVEERERYIPTTMDRLAVLHANMDRVLVETRAARRVAVMALALTVAAFAGASAQTTIQVPCGDDARAVIAAARPGDRLLLGACRYSAEDLAAIPDGVTVVAPPGHTWPRWPPR